jgi:hypothetical protein
MNDNFDLAACTPRINLNGTSGSALLEAYVTALVSLENCYSMVSATSPHGRDWQTETTSTAYKIAVEQHATRMKMIKDVKDQIETIALAVADELNKRKS